MAKTDLTAARLRELLDYNPDTGVFTRLASTGPTARAGDIAGTKKHTGYICIGVCGRIYLAHRLAWLYLNGEWPSGVIDHINGIKSDNRAANIRDITVVMNAQNMRAGHKDSTSRYLGVSAKRGKWRATIFSEGRHISLGVFCTPEEASAAYLFAKGVYHEGAMRVH